MNTLKDKRIAFHTLGCKVNIYETEVMSGEAVREGAIPVDFSEKADIYVINTCSVTNMADRKSRQMLRRAKKLSPDAVLVATGCYVETENAESLGNLGIDLLIGNEEKKDFVKVLTDYLEKGIRPVKTDIAGVKEYRREVLPSVRMHTRADVKVQDGCNQFCTYCIIPFARGRIRSKKPEDVVREIADLAAQGISEFVLTGIHLSSYGLDFETDGHVVADYKAVAANARNLLYLIGEVHKIDGVKRLRIGSLEPRIVTKAFAEGLKALPKVCHHFHLALQSGSDETLRRMNRHYTTAEYREAVSNLRAVYENPAVTTDVIVGFAGETEAEFAESLAFFEEMAFFEPNVFQYSKRKGTAAEKMPNQVPEPVKKERSERMLRVGERTSEAYRIGMLGKTVSVLTEEKVSADRVPAELRTVFGDSVYTGHTGEFLSVYTGSARKSNEIVNGKLEKIGNFYFVK